MNVVAGIVGGLMVMVMLMDSHTPMASATASVASEAVALPGDTVADLLARSSGCDCHP